MPPDLYGVKMAKGDGGSYHHGNLRATLMSTGLDLIAERGIDGFTLRELARRAGVSHTAPYHHFPDRAALVAAIVAESYERLAEVLRESAAAGSDPADRVRRMGLGYVAFALDHPARYRLMFRPELTGGEPGTDVTSADRTGADAFAALVNGIEAMRAEPGLAPGLDVGGAVVSAWAAVHGVASLILDGGAIGVRRTDRQRALALAETVVDVMLRGITDRS